MICRLPWLHHLAFLLVPASAVRHSIVTVVFRQIKVVFGLFTFPRHHKDLPSWCVTVLASLARYCRAAAVAAGRGPRIVPG